jgi:drug/metabolite transporter (DMT)-like permease
VPLSALALALGAAVLHATWNALIARARDVQAATTVVLALSVALFAPVAAATWRVEADALPWIAASALLELAYFVLLATAYGRSDLSMVYPVARGAAPVLVLVGATLAGAALGVAQALGVLLVGGGVLLVRGLRPDGDSRGVVLALVIAVTIAGYTLVDKEGIEHAAPVPYLVLVLLPVALVALAWQLAAGKRNELLGQVGVAAAAAALASFGAYALVLAALSLAPAAAVAAVRETSILFAVVLGAAVLREAPAKGRYGGAALIVLGVALVASG